MHDNLEKENETSRKPSWLPIILVAIVGVIIVYGIAVKKSENRNKREVARCIVCRHKLRELGEAFAIYAEMQSGRYPAPDKWCDLLIEHTKVTERTFQCLSGEDGRCKYAINPNAEPNGPPDLVLVFETNPGWNQYGGRELMLPQKHEKKSSKGSNVLFVNGDIKFVKVEDVNGLKWEIEEDTKPSSQE